MRVLDQQLERWCPMQCGECGEQMQAVADGNGVLWVCPNGHTRNG